MASMLKRRASQLVFGMCLMGAVGTFPADAQAQEQVDAKQILALIAEANAHFDAEEFEPALEKYKRAFELYPDPSLLYRMGLSAERTGNIFDAIDYLERFVDAVPDDKTAKQVAERLEDLRAKMPARFMLESDPAGATVYADSMQSESLGTTPLQVDVEPGSRVFFFEMEGFQNEVRNAEAKRGENPAISVTLKEARSLAIVDPNESVGASPDGEGSNFAVWGWVTTGLGVATLATGGVFSFMSMQATDDVNSYDKRAPGATQAELNGLKDDANGYYDTSIYLYAAGGVLTAAGVTLLVIDALQDEPAGTSLFVSPNPEGASVGLQGTF